MRHFDIARKNALIEAVALHGRSLLDFFSNHKPKSTDVVASDFTTGYACPFNVKTDPLEAIRTKANKQIIHLTTDRTLVEAKGFEANADGQVILRNLEPAISLFEKHLTSDFSGLFKCNTTPVAFAIVGQFPGASSQTTSILVQSS
jgi:hypothetical protein